VKVGELLDMLAAVDAARKHVNAEEWRDLDIVVRGADNDGNDFCGNLVSVGIEIGCGDSGEFLAFDASNEPDRTNP